MITFAKPTTKLAPAPGSTDRVRPVIFLCSFLLGGMLILHGSKVALPIWKFTSVDNPKIISTPQSGSASAHRKNDDSSASDSYVLAIPAPNELRNFSLIADGEIIELTEKHGAALEPGEYMLGNGFLCWMQEKPPGAHYDLISAQYFKWAGWFGFLVIIAGIAIGATYLRGLLIATTAFVQELLQALSAVTTHLTEACSPIFHQNQKSVEFELTNERSCDWKLISVCGLILVSLIYLNTGTLAPYNLFGPLFVDLGPSAVSGDNDYHRAVYLLVDGRGSEVHAPYNMLFRRVLFSWLAYPAMKTFGFIVGGVAVSIILNLLGFVVFCFYVTKRWGRAAGGVSALLLCCYPGCAYYGGMPYCYSIIFPSCLISAVLLCELERSESLRTIALVSLSLGVLCLGYDLLAYLLPAVALLFTLRRRIRYLPLAIPLLCIPQIAWCSFIFRAFGSEALINSNSSTIANTLLGLLQIYKPQVLFQVLHSIPTALSFISHTYFFSTFVFLPVLFGFALLSGKFMKDTFLTKAELSFLLSAVSICFVCAVSPPCQNPGFSDQWRLSDNWTVRLYQPVFAIFVLFLARKFSTLKLASIGWHATLQTALILCICGNLLTGFGTILNNPFGLASTLYYEFYPAGNPERLQWNLAIYGRLPLGFFDSAKATAIQKERDKGGAATISQIRHIAKPLSIQD